MNRVILVVGRFGYVTHLRVPWPNGVGMGLNELPTLFYSYVLIVVLVF